MVGQPPAAYMAERRGNLQDVIRVFEAQRKYLDRYVSAVDALSADDKFEAGHWMLQAGWAGTEICHLHPFRQKLVRTCELAGFASVDEFRERAKLKIAAAGLQKV